MALSSLKMRLSFPRWLHYVLFICFCFVLYNPREIRTLIGNSGSISDTAYTLPRLILYIIIIFFLENNHFRQRMLEKH